jgi:hypothetical protein
MCRIAVDPDPTNEPRGRSGYTMALASEDPLDQVIRLQPDDYVRRNLRKPAERLGFHVGVEVRSVTFDGAPCDCSPNLLGARVRLAGKNEMFDGPIFESRNSIVGSDDTMMFVINPFDLVVEKKGDDGQTLLSLRAFDYVNPGAIEQELWQIADPAIYGRRLPTVFIGSSPEAKQAISVFNGYSYFRGRRAFLQEEIDRLQSLGGDDPATELAIEEARSRLYQLEFWGDTIISKLGFLVQWEFDINGPQEVKGDLGGRADTEQPWHVRMWFGGWDGDLLMGYIRGALSIPFEPACP